MSKLPIWARKPDHKKEVVATARGWMVKETGEYLKLVKDLDTKLKELQKETEVVVSAVVEPEQKEPETLSEPEEQPVRKRRGRKPKAEAEQTTEE